MNSTFYPASHDEVLEPDLRDFYIRALQIVRESGARFLVGGAYAFASYTGIVRHTKDFDIFLHESDIERVLAAFGQAGYRTDLSFPHWLGKVFHGEGFVDLIFSSGNGVAEVDEDWFEYATPAVLLGTEVLLCPVEEMIWSKSYVMERERYDGADVAHLLRANADQLDWRRLLRRFGANYRVLLSYVILFGFIYPGERDRIPGWVLENLLRRLQSELATPPVEGHICQGTLLSRAQFLIDVDEWGYQDARLAPRGGMSAEDIDHWTASIEQDS
jgi:hypothetical protein